MPNELENKELIEKLPKEGVHCYPANPSKITRNRILSVIFFILGVFLIFIGLLKVTDNMLKIALLVVGCLSSVISLLVFAQSFLIAKFRVAVDYNEKNVVLRYRYSKIAIPLRTLTAETVRLIRQKLLLTRISRKMQHSILYLMMYLKMPAIRHLHLILNL